MYLDILNYTVLESLFCVKLCKTSYALHWFFLISNKMVERAGPKDISIGWWMFHEFFLKGFFFTSVFLPMVLLYILTWLFVSKIKNNYNRWINVWKFSFVSYLFCVSGRLKTILNLRYLNWFFKNYAIKTLIILFWLTKHYFRFGQTVPQCSLKQFSTYIPQKSAKWYNVFFFFKWEMEK